ncbi:MAG TPA: type II toxin-antitoxin system Phd/YefM family antitoxin [Candidatus Competibacteraceae bacterium]|nr:type II toxin-antitoxin system Phd/YefM family antitoxin [Candidatus Competibacteraceae bacterium]
MNTIPASEIKRRGIAAVDEALKHGPVHIIKNNRPRYVVLSEEDYARLAARAGVPTHEQGDIWDLILQRPWQGTRTREEIDAALKEERDSWGAP